MSRDFPGGPVVKTFTAGGAGSIPGWGTKILHATQCGQKKKKKRKRKHQCLGLGPILDQLNHNFWQWGWTLAFKKKKKPPQVSLMSVKVRTATG